MEQGKDFLKGVEYYLTIGSKKAALFSLQQAAECFLIAIIRVVNGYTTNLHNLDTLLDVTRMFTNDIAAIFDLTDQYNLKLFTVLKHAYINVRYKDGYELDDDAATALYPYIKNLMFVVEQVYQKYLLTNTL
ncbi:HEPN domain-containing protein [Mucilaginibacter psychrotolerans]|uniref:HEPN domain-containing protein n=1 Tax=Mucilaginibacter psychrotolerans TaxID=1524096 RepID=A0A4Y8SAU7_9SPHI|nr:HEPN domain-containing protein [Mucilaginibacter psychrotolerans]TFF36149.1 HEPN domain-containing protein [Mucilaginibacter psychrotolerans]